MVVRRQAHGGFAGDPDRKRQGSFADTDRVVIVSYEGDVERTRITGLGGARRLLARDGLDEATVDRAVGDLHRGQAVVLLDPPPSRLTSSGCIILGVRNTWYSGGPLAFRVMLYRPDGRMVLHRTIFATTCSDRMYSRGSIVRSLLGVEGLVPRRA